MLVPSSTAQCLELGLFVHLDLDEGSTSYGPNARCGPAVLSHVRRDITTNHAETYFSQLKRSLDGTFHHVSREHLHRYLAEFDFRFTTCKLSDTERIDLLVGRVGGRRLMYRQPAGGVGHP